MIDRLYSEYLPICDDCAAKRNRPGASEFAGVHAEGCTRGTCGNGRPVPEDDTETREKTMRYRQKHGLV